MLCSQQTTAIHTKDQRYKAPLCDTYLCHGNDTKLHAVISDTDAISDFVGWSKSSRDNAAAIQSR